MVFHHPAPTAGGASFVLLADDPDVDRLADALRSELADVEVLDTDAEGAPLEAPLLTGRLGMDTVLVAPVASPVPDGEALAACHPVWWEDPTPVAGHRAQAIVVVRSEEDPDEDPRAHALRHAMATSVAVAALLATDDAVGVYVGPAGATFPPAEYRDHLAAARTGQQLPVDLWVTTWLEPHEDGTVSGWTHGLTSFGHADVVVEDSRRAPSDVYVLLTSLAAHVVTTGDRLEPGHSLDWDDGVHPVEAAPDSSDAHPLLAIAF